MISAILPSVRPHLTETCVKSVLAAAGDVPIQVIVITPDGHDSNVEHHAWNGGALRSQVITTRDERLGVVHAVNLGAKIATGKYLFTLSDECLLKVRSLERMYQRAEALGGLCILTPKHVPNFQFYYYKRMFAPFPFVSRFVLDRAIAPRMMFRPEYKSFYADPDLSFRVRVEFGIVPEIVKEAVIFHNQQHDASHYSNVSKHLDEDRKTFRENWDRWGWGEFADPV